MEKKNRLSGLKSKNFICVIILLVVLIAETIVVLGKLDGIDIDGSLKKQILGFQILVIVLLVIGTAYTLWSLQKAEQESDGKEDKYKKLLLNLPIGFAQAQIIKDQESNRNFGYRICDANDTFGKLFQLEVSDYFNKDISQSGIQSLQSISAWFEAYENSGTKLGEVLSVEITLEHLNKVFQTVMYKSEPDYINMVVIDVTEQKETENKLSAAIEDANAAYKTQSEFLANMSHEIRTPINGILGMLQLTLMADDLQADYKDNLITAKNCANNLLRLINDILDLSKLEAGKYNLKEEEFNLKSVIEETVAAQIPSATGKKLSLDCNFTGQIPKMVRGDSQRIQQVLNCLLSNAIKFTNEGGVRVKVACLNSNSDPNQIKMRIAVSDSGIGISDKDKSKLFIRFSQVDASDTRQYGGSGLGLVITKQIVELMGGDITVQSQEGLGSTFIVEVPLTIVKASDAKVEKEDRKEDPALYSVTGRSRARILVAEDEPVNQQVIGKLLGMAGYSYDIAENGEKAVELYQKKDYQAALFDVQMPVMDGLEATQKIRDLETLTGKKRLPIIAVTARAMFGDKERILEAKLDDYIAKPYNLNDVVDTLKKYVKDTGL